ncbi:MAG TPA: SdrD B-like domain-containing protein [Bacillota bacterium]|nr:SdrD B-like domain-containing protein [Bacillota bacterium]
MGNKWNCLCLVLLIICCGLGPVKAADNGLETSVVFLIVKAGDTVIGKDPFFEILDFNDYQLVPLNSLAEWLELEIDYDREKNLVHINSSRFNRKVAVDLNQSRYMAADARVPEEEWNGQPPVVLAGNFYVSPLLIENIAQVKITWDAKYQELTVQGDWLTLRLNNNPQLKTATDSNQPQEGQPLEGPGVSLGAIEYMIGWEDSRDSFGDQTTAQVVEIRADGRVGPWMISASGEISAVNGSQLIDPALTFAKAEYDEKGQRIVLGDSEINLEETLGAKELRGLVWMSSERQLTERLLAFTTVSGTAAPGDQVSLFVNGQLYNQLVLNAGNRYIFTNVPLTPRRVNIIQIMIHKSTGETEEVLRKVAACPDILDPGAAGYLLTAGNYRQTGVESWEGDVIALKTACGLTDRITLNSEIAQFRPLYFDGGTATAIDGADLGIVFRLGEGTIYTLDGLAGGLENTPGLETGWKASVLSEMEHGFFETAFFYVPGEVTEGLRQVVEGRGVKALGEMELSNQRVVSFSGNRMESLAIPDHFTGEAELKLTQGSGASNQPVDTIALLKKINATATQAQDWSNLLLEQVERGQGFYHQAVCGLGNLDSFNGPEAGNLKWISFEANFLKSFSNTLLASYSINPVGNWRENEFHDLTINSAAELKWNTAKTWISAKGKVTGITGTGLDSGLKIETLEVGGTAKYMITNTANCYCNYNSTSQSTGGYSYNTGAIGISGQWPQNGWNLWADLGYASPMGEQVAPQWSNSLGISKVYTSGLELVLEMDKTYDSRWSNHYQETHRLSLRQGLAFGQGRIGPFKYSEKQNLSLISGIVYLDANGNGRYDPGEKGLPHIKMQLDGAIAETNADGIYTFNRVDPGLYRVNFHLRSLPADYTPVTGEQLVKIKPAENMFVDFGVTINGAITGRAFTDLNANGRRDPGEAPLPWVGVMLDGSRKAYTLSDGSFCFENIPLGAHTITIIPETLPGGMKVKGEEQCQVLITEDSLDGAEIQFPVVFEFLSAAGE